MKFFDVYKHPEKGYQAVKQGFGWPAFFFSAFWAFAKHLWAFGLFISVGIILFWFVGMIFWDGYTGEVLLVNGFAIGFHYFIGVYGNDWRRKNLEECGFVRVNSVLAATSKIATWRVAK